MVHEDSYTPNIVGGHWPDNDDRWPSLFPQRQSIVSGPRLTAGTVGRLNLFTDVTTVALLEALGIASQCSSSSFLRLVPFDGLVDPSCCLGLDLPKAH